MDWSAAGRISSVPNVVLRAAEEGALATWPKWVLVLMATGCLSLAAVVAGLTLGLMSLDMIGLEILQNSQREKERIQATKIAEIRKDGNLLLVTLLLTNSIATELLPLVLDALFPGSLTSLVLSVTLVMLFGEIIPQAVCSRHALEVGFRFVDLVKVLRFVTYPIAKPIAWCLDRALGVEMGQTYTREELKGLVDVHSRNKYGVLTGDETSILKGALDLERKKVSQIMTKASDVFMLHVDERLNKETLKQILHYGHSRVPLYLGERSNIVGLLLIKQLIMIDPDDEIPIRALFNEKKRPHSIRVAPAVYVSQDVELHSVLNEFQMGRSHMAIVYDDISKPNDERKLLGIVSLEDIIEEILQEEIIDETDVYVDNKSRRPVLSKSKEGKLVRTLQNAEVVTGSRLRGTKHILIREIDLKSIKQPMLDEMERDMSYGALSTKKVSRKEVPVIRDDLKDPDADDMPGLLDVATLMPGRANAVPSEQDSDSFFMDPENPENPPPSDEQLWKSGTDVVNDGAVALMISDDRPPTAPPRIEYDDSEEW